MSDRKKDHIELAFKSKTAGRPWWAEKLSYEPMLATHNDVDISISFLDKKLKSPYFVSSMTGGTEKAKLINERLAKMCKHFSMGMGLGSCRPLLESSNSLKDFDIRHLLGDDLPLMANLGIYQVEELLQNSKLHLVDELLKKLSADILMVHVNPLQEYTQKEGDHFKVSPLETLKKLVDVAKFKIGVKEVGQGFGPKSLKKLHELPIQVIEFASFGGTNFTTLELSRHSGLKPAIRDSLKDLEVLGHEPLEMIQMVNELPNNGMDYILSGGIDSSLYGHFLSLNFKRNHAVGMASKFLEYALESEESLYEFATGLVETKKLASQCVFLKEEI